MIQRNKIGNRHLNRTASGKIESTKDQKDQAEVQPKEELKNWTRKDYLTRILWQIDLNYFAKKVITSG